MKTIFLPAVRMLQNILTSVISFIARQAHSIIQTNDVATPPSWCASTNPTF